MKETVFCFILVTFWIGMFAQVQLEEDNGEDYLCLTVYSHPSIWDRTKYYKVLQDTLYVFKRQRHYIPYGASQQLIDSIEQIKATSEILELYRIKEDDLLILDSLYERTNWLDNHSTEIITLRQHPRFHIRARYKGKEMSGWSNDCYRESTYILVDWFNKVYPQGDIVNYDKKKLMKRE